MLNFLKKSLKILRIGFIVFAVYTVIISLFIYFTSGNKIQTKVNPIKENRKAIYAIINDPKFKATKDGRTQIALYRTLECGMIGEACTNNPDDGDKNFYKSTFGYLTTAIVFPYANPPASGIYWAYSGLQNAGFIPKTYAAEGLGFAAIQPLSDIWKIFRDVAFVLLVLIMVTIGFMIMFRLKINPQTVISLENSLPRIVVSLLIITFSFAIAGFLIDLMYLSIGLGIAAFGNHINVVSEQAKVFGRGANLWDDVFVNGTIWQVGQALFNILPNTINNTLRAILAILGWWFIIHIPALGLFPSGDVADKVVETGGILKTIIQVVAVALTGPLLFFFAPIILSLVVFLTALFIFFRLFFLLFKSYLMILLLTVFSPIILLLHAIPGQNMFFRWIRNLVSHLIAFPLVVILIITSSLIVNVSISSGKLWSAPFLYSPNPQALSILVGVGLLFLIPDIIKAVREAMGIKPSPLSFGAGLFFGGAAGAGGTATEYIGRYGSLRFGLNQLQGGFIGKMFGRKGNEGQQRGGPPPPLGAH